jgi:penicillin-binding protein 1A
MVRQEMVKRYGEDAYNDGYRVYTTITRKVQQAADKSADVIT